MSLKTALLLGSTGETGRELLKQLVASPSYGRYVTDSHSYGRYVGDSRVYHLQCTSALCTV